MSVETNGHGMLASVVARYLEQVLGAPVTEVAVRPLGGDGGEDVKGFGYGVPLEVRCRVRGERRDLVIARTRPVSGFGHDYPADRAWQALFSHPAYNSFPRHARSLDVGCAVASGRMVSLGEAVEFFQLVEKVEGQLYRVDLDRLLTGALTDLDVARATALARFLAEAHALKHDDPAIYHRRIRELVGHGECLMGILDSYPHPYAPLPASACEAIERAAIGWRWRLRGRTGRLARTHGDFHPWNILFRDGTDFSVLDRSRGEWGEPADDVAALAINYLFFGLRRAAREGRPGLVAEPFAGLYRTFMETYLVASQDGELEQVLPPFFAFRAFVLAHPRWYPTLDDVTRRTIIAFGRDMMEGDAVDADALASRMGAAA
jgi:aminoglycoside phosphotransferase (APT) family kinase protein